MKKLADKIKSRRKELGLTQAELAKKIHAEGAAISMWENHKRNIPKGRFEELSEALQIPLEEIQELAKNNYIMENKFNKMFYDLESPADAMRLIEYTMTTFEVDSAMKVTLKAMLRNYLLLELLITMQEKETYRKEEGEDFEWDYTWFQANVEYNAINQLYEKKHFDFLMKLYEHECETPLDVAGGRTYEVLSGFLSPKEIDPEFIRIFRIHLLEYCHHLDDLATGLSDAKNKYYCAKFVED